MAGFADLVPQAQPALVPDGCIGEATAGRDWEWLFTGVVDAAGDPVDLSAVTVTSQVLDISGGGTVIALTGVGNADGSFTLSATEADTASVAASPTPKQYTWSCAFDDGSESVQVWNPGHSSPFMVRGN